MQYRHLGRAGIRVSELSLGSWVTFKNQVDVEAAVEIMAAAYEAGVNFFDNAESYANGQSEEVMGAALKQLGWRRGSYLVTTKIFWGLHDNPNERNTLNRKRLIEDMPTSTLRARTSGSSSYQRPARAEGRTSRAIKIIVALSCAVIWDPAFCSRL